MTTVTFDDIQRDLLSYLERVRAGETLLVTEADTPLAEIKPPPPQISQQRPFGLCRGAFVTPDDFDVPLSDDVLKDFEVR